MSVLCCQTSINTGLVSDITVNVPGKFEDFLITVLPEGVNVKVLALFATPVPVPIPVAVKVVPTAFDAAPIRVKLVVPVDVIV